MRPSALAVPLVLLAAAPLLAEPAQPCPVRPAARTHEVLLVPVSPGASPVSQSLGPRLLGPQPKLASGASELEVQRECLLWLRSAPVPVDFAVQATAPRSGGK